MSKHAELLRQLNALLRLTQTEIMIAETRRGQARTPAVQRELAENADMARQRSQLLADAIRTLGGVPDVLGVTAGRVAATAKATAEQGQDLVDALFGDLALEHELLDRARLAVMLADELDEGATRRTLERLEEAHTATIDWLMTRLGEVAVGGPAALRPTPMQTLAGVGRQLGTMPSRNFVSLANRSIEGAATIRRGTADSVRSNVDRVRQLVVAAGEIWTAGRDASLKRSEELANDRGARDTARTVNRARRELGAVDGDELPIRRYDSLTVGAAVTAVNRLSEADDVRTILAYETAHKARKGVLDASEAKLEELATALAQAS